ncbi:hypothetical protein FRC07_001274 [Ceratobasidium sp. 392]|nr:hypothetical protein FRC07_001274 [Ceratobasidium sp. 392]
MHKAAVSGVKLLAGDKILSASDDFTLSLSTSTTSTRRLTSHTRAITSLSLIHSFADQAVSCGKDGTLRIWDITSENGRQLGMLRSSGDVAINALSVSGSSTITAMALQSGHFDLVDLNTRTTIFSSSSTASTTKTYGALDTIALYALSESDGRHLLVTGSRNGMLSFYICVLRDGGVEVRSVGNCMRNGAGVSDIKLVPSDDTYPTVLVATTDGLPCQLKLIQLPESGAIEFEIAAEYAGGPDCSPVRSIIGRAESREVWMAGDDGVIWVYEL